ncbi:kinase-like domain-containing protein [Lactarius akahatsu]|uniref:Kinase-like domain-containing protein n=1 Tax=Lactarius akahatsu TaxID=416441 RepID=A0AAD4LNV3_9AGAM|nr:kinase-like domain-containing protein [Lactarius akahatsu]
MTSISFIGAVKDEWQLYRFLDFVSFYINLRTFRNSFSDLPEDYALGPPIGFGSSSIVYHATYHPKSSQDWPIPCALKVLDLDRLPQGSLRLLQRETQLMSLSKHPNVLRVRGSWLDGHKLHIALRLMNAGSAADVMQYAWPGGMEEEVVRCILKQALEGLNYLHINGFIHRDVKAANLLIDDDGTVLLGDLGVAAPLSDEDHTHVHENAKLSRIVVFDNDVNIAPRRSRVGKRRSFVGTPCWMAPELISGIQYDSSADIWSFGITALELAQGRAPRSRESSRTVLLQIVQGEPPTLDREGGVHKYSRAFKEIVERCLVKDPSLRPTAAQLLQMPFFRNAKKHSYLVGTILRDLPPLAQRLERRKQPSLLLHGTVDSWDFPTTLLAPSPIQSVYHRSRHIDAKDDRPDERTAEAEKLKEPMSTETERETSPSATDSPPNVPESRSPLLPLPTQNPSNAPSGVGYLATSAAGSGLPATSTTPAFPISVPVSATPLNQTSSSSSPPPSTPSLWRRIRRSTGHSDLGTKHFH